MPRESVGGVIPGVIEVETLMAKSEELLALLKRTPREDELTPAERALVCAWVMGYDDLRDDNPHRAREAQEGIALWVVGASEAPCTFIEAKRDDKGKVTGGKTCRGTGPFGCCDKHYPSWGPGNYLLEGLEGASLGQVGSGICLCCKTGCQDDEEVVKCCMCASSVHGKCARISGGAAGVDGTLEYRAAELYFEVCLAMRIPDLRRLARTLLGWDAESASAVFTVDAGYVPRGLRKVVTEQRQAYSLAAPGGTPLTGGARIRLHRTPGEAEPLVESGKAAGEGGEGGAGAEDAAGGAAGAEATAAARRSERRGEGETPARAG